MNLQKKLASQILKVGRSRVWMDPEHKKDVDAAITKADVRRMILKGYIKKLPEKLKVREVRKKRKKGIGSRKGSRHAKVPAKRKWITTVRPLRKMLKELKTSNQLDNKTYRKLYMLVKGGMFRSRSHLKIYLEQHGLIKKGEK